MALCFASGTGCPHPSEEQPPPEVPAPRIEVVSGRYQVGRAGETLAPVVVRVVDATGSPLVGVRVAFRVREPPAERFGMTGGQAALSAPEATTDGEGTAATVPTLGERSGQVVLEARLPGDRAWPVLIPLWSYPADTGGRTPLCLLSFNDFHVHLEPWGQWAAPEGGLARLVSALIALRAANEAAGVATLVVNTGDDFENTLFQDQPGSFEELLLTWDRAGVDLYQVGNHDFHFGLPFLADKILAVRDQLTGSRQGHPLRILWGNVDPSTLTGAASGYADLFETHFDDPADERLFGQTAVLDASDLRVGLVGVVTDAAVYTQVVGDPPFFRALGAQSPDAQGMEFLSPDPRDSTYIGSAIDDLDARGAHLVVVTSHAGLGLDDRVNIPPGKDEHIARYGQGPASGRAVDVILSGHSHVLLGHAAFLDNPAGGRTGILQALEGGVAVARADLLVDPTDGTVAWVDSGIVQIDETVPADPDTAEQVAAQAAALDDEYPDRHTPLAWNETFLGSAERTHCGLGQLINEAFLHSVRPIEEPGQTFLPIVVPSTYRTHLHPGPVDLDLAYQVLSMHKMDAQGTHDDTLAYIAFRPGLYDVSFFYLAATERQGITLAEYAVELVHSLEDVLEDILPSAGGELSLDVLQLGRVAYRVDATAPAFERVVPGSLRVDGGPPDPAEEYRLVGAHSILSTLARALDAYLIAEDAETGQAPSSVLIPDPDTGEPFTDTGIPLWESLVGYLGDSFGQDVAIPAKLITVTGSAFRTVQPDLSVQSADIAFSPRYPRPGETVTVTARVRNLGEVPVESFTATLHLETTPWDRTDDPDPFAPLQGLPEGYLGSLLPLASVSLSVGAYPATATARFEWSIPEDLIPGTYPLEVRLGDLVISTVDPNTGSPYVEHSTANNWGRQRARLLRVW